MLRGIDTWAGAARVTLGPKGRNVALDKSFGPRITKDGVTVVGAISADGDLAIGRLIAEAMDTVGNDGLIVVEQAKSLRTELEVVESMPWSTANSRRPHRRTAGFATPWGWEAASQSK